MSKKLLSVVLALALVFSCFAVSAFAIGGIGYESEEDAAYYKQTWALGEPVNNGNGTYTVDVKLTANYGVGTIQFSVIKNVTSGSLTLTNVALGSDIPASWEAETAFSDVNGKVMIIPYPTVEAAFALDCTTEKVIAKLTYTASSDVAATLAINIADAKTQTNPGGTLFAARMSDNNVVTGTSMLGQTVNATNTVSIGNAAPPAQAPELAVVDGTIGVIDTTRTDLDAEGEGTTCNGYLYGFDLELNADVSELFEVVGDGTMNVVENSEGLVNTTGTMVQVVDNDGNVVAEYVLIVFGDVNGDALIDGTDASVIELHEAWEQRVFTYQEFAGDVNVDGITDGTDASICELHDAWEERIDVATVISALGF